MKRAIRENHTHKWIIIDGEFHRTTALALLSFSGKLKNTCEASINTAENKQ